MANEIIVRRGQTYRRRYTYRENGVPTSIADKLLRFRRWKAKDFATGTPDLSFDQITAGLSDGRWTVLNQTTNPGEFDISFSEADCTVDSDPRKYELFAIKGSEKIPVVDEDYWFTQPGLFT